jgi:phage virion morphogenesis protein
MITVQINEDEITQALDRVALALTDMTPLMQDIGELMVDSTRENFKDGTDPDGTPWAPKSAATLDAYRRRGDGQPTRPLIGPTRTLSTTINAEPSADRVAWGSNVIQAAVMQFGAQAGEFGARIGRDKNGRDFMMSIPWGDIPARPYLGVGQNDIDAIVATVEEYLGGFD